ncbi:hypothetical protein RI054_45g154040 [Pseudoscourfieldia marina]
MSSPTPSLLERITDAVASPFYTRRRTHRPANQNNSNNSATNGTAIDAPPADADVPAHNPPLSYDIVPSDVTPNDADANVLSANEPNNANADDDAPNRHRRKKTVACKILSGTYAGAGRASAATATARREVRKEREEAALANEGPPGWRGLRHSAAGKAAADGGDLSRYSTYTAGTQSIGRQLQETAAREERVN